MVVLVTGAGGQLGQSIQFIAQNYPKIHFVFCNSKQLDITDIESVKNIFQEHQPDYCINAAAYTAVDKAESEKELAYAINVLGVKNLAEVCKANNTKLVHISTDFVFDGENPNEKPYTENDIPHPTGVYGLTKWEGEKAVQAILEQHYIVRTSWVYSQFGANFMKTMLRLASERSSLNVVNDQIGTPTHAVDLANALVQIIVSDAQHPALNRYGIYHYSNEGKCSWYYFAKKIFENHHITIDLNPIPTASYPTPAKRPNFSVMDKTKIKNAFQLEIPHWETSLKQQLK